VVAEPIHVIVRATDDGFYATSPQAPGLVFGRRTIEELHAELQGVLAFYFKEPGPFAVIEHHERNSC
jgi:predicted RNase H-like HicB family nuclease